MLLNVASRRKYCPDMSRDPQLSGLIPIIKPIVDANPNEIGSEVVVRRVERHAGKRRTGTGSAGASRRDARALPKAHVQVFGRNGPCSIQSNFRARAGGPPGGIEILAAVKRRDGCRCSRRNISERTAL